MLDRNIYRKGMMLYGAGGPVEGLDLVAKSGPSPSSSPTPTLAEIGLRMDATRQKLEVLAAQLRARSRSSA